MILNRLFRRCQKEKSMSWKYLTFLAVGVFVVGMAGTSLANPWSQEKWSYGPNEGVDHTKQVQAVPPGYNSQEMTNPMSQTGSTEMQGPMETGSLPDQGYSSFEEEISHGQRALNSDQINGTVPSENWNYFPHGRENIEAGE
jgi:hypothetical protein